MQLHGTEDFRPPIAQVRQTIEQWRAANGCGPRPEVAVDDSAPSVLTRERYLGCRDDAEVILYVVQGGGHFWPGPLAGDAASRAVPASSIIWDFFQRHPRPE